MFHPQFGSDIEKRSSTRNLFLRVVLFTLIMALAVPQGLSAQYARPDLEKIPVKDLVANLAKKVETDPKNIELLTNLGRVYAMAYSQKTTEIEINKTNPDRAWFGYEHSNAPFTYTKSTDDKTEQKAAKANLELAITTFKKAVALDKDNLVTQLSLAWCLEQSGDKAAIKMYRSIIKSAWEKEKDMDRAGLGWHSVTAEAAGYLQSKLDEKKDAKELQELQDKVQQLSKIRRPITPIAVGLRPEMTVDQIVSRQSHVLFDLDASGQKKSWSWISQDAAWLVYDQKGDGKIESGIQLFGNVTFLCFWENGYHALNSLDKNNDGVLNNQELQFLALWQDSNQNGISDPGEVKSLSEHKIVQLNCKPVYSKNQSDVAASCATGITFADGRTRPTYDVVLHEKK